MSVTQETLDDFMRNLEKKLVKMEEDITTKKQRKFIRDFKDYQAGRILTFHRKYDHMYKEEASEVGVKNLEITAGSTEELLESDVSDGNLSDVSDTIVSKGVTQDEISVNEDEILNLEGLGISLDDPCPSNLKPKSTFLPAIQCDAINVLEREVIKQLKEKN
ncbi:hypothetical protein NDU88_004683 [Pleurodeles waltl]|uniref:Uncharacterized protein n=1 Tax=Pleurodeles waltl TaxID=8319 RepID=A0AAV7M924_PLEWA|nr:hypothetical protein NDU88_004683 [Pleurodeles waltl]